MKTLLTLFAVVALTLAFAPAAEACCTPCENWCDGAADSTYCCSYLFYSESNRCGLTTCGEWRAASNAAWTAPTSLQMTPVTASACEALPFAVEPWATELLTSAAD